MNKPRVRLMPIGECHNGQRAWRKICQLPITIVTVNRKKNVAIYHIGHAFDMRANKMRMSGWIKVWAIVG